MSDHREPTTEWRSRVQEARKLIEAFAREKPAPSTSMKAICPAPLLLSPSASITMTQIRWFCDALRKRVYPEAWKIKHQGEAMSIEKICGTCRWWKGERRYFNCHAPLPLSIDSLHQKKVHHDDGGFCPAHSDGSFEKAVRELVVIGRCFDCGWAREYPDGDYCTFKEKRGFFIELDNTPNKLCPIRRCPVSVTAVEAMLKVKP